MTETATLALSPVVYQLRSSREFFERTTSVFTEEHQDFAPKEGMFTVTQQVAHAADTFNWFHDALLDLKGFDMDFEAMVQRMMKIETLAEAREVFDKSHARLLALAEASSLEAFDECLPANDPIMPGAPRTSLYGATIEHTAHHRGSLAVYARLLGLKPPMPYGDMA